MLSFAIFLSLATLASPARSQNLSGWTAEHQVPGGDWTVSPQGDRASFNVSNQRARSFFYGIATPLVKRGKVTVTIVGDTDNDFFGFVFGFKPRDSISRAANYLLLDWKRGTELNGAGLFAYEGMALSRVTGPGSTAPNGASIDFWNHTRDVTELARARSNGNRGWGTFRDYEFDIDYSPNRITIHLDGTLEFDITGTFPTDGFFGFYNFSQNAVRYQFELPDASAEEFGEGCPGGDAEAVLAPVPGSLPRLDENFTLQFNSPSISSSASVYGVFGFSSTTWSGLDLPRSLADLGAPSCMQYVAAEYITLLPQSGTNAMWDIKIPDRQRAIGTEFFVQGLVVDPTGLVPVAVTNAVRCVVGSQ